MSGTNNNGNSNNNSGNNVHHENNFNSPNDGENENNKTPNISDRYSQYSSSIKNRTHNRNNSNNSVTSASQLDESYDNNHNHNNNNNNNSYNNTLNSSYSNLTNSKNGNNRYSMKAAPAIINIIHNLYKDPIDDSTSSNNGNRNIKNNAPFKSLDSSTSNLSHSQSSIDSPLHSSTNNSKSPNHYPQSPNHQSADIRPLKHIASRSSPSISSNDLLNQDTDDEDKPTTTTTTTTSPNNNNNNVTPIKSITNKINKLEIPASQLRSSNNAIDSSAAPSSNTSRPQFSQAQSEVPSSCSPPSNNGNTLLNKIIDEKEKNLIVGDEDDYNNNRKVDDAYTQQTVNLSPSSNSSTTTTESLETRDRRMTKLFDDAPIAEVSTRDRGYTELIIDAPIYYTTTIPTDSPPLSQPTSPKIKQPKPDEDEELAIAKNKKQQKTPNSSKLTVNFAESHLEKPEKLNINGGDDDSSGDITTRIRAESVTAKFKDTEVMEGEGTINIENDYGDDAVNDSTINQFNQDGQHGDGEDGNGDGLPIQPPPQQPLTPKQILIIFSGLMVSLFLSSLDMTIVATALPAIVADLQGLEQLPWVVTIYLLTSTSVSPLFGKFSDIFGKKILLLSSLVVFLIGSLLCAVATTMNMLILARAIQGLGGGGLMSAVMIVMAEIVPLRDRGKYQGLLGAVYAVSSVVGPLMGGTFTDNITWRWAFWINLPLGAVAFIVVFFALKIPQKVIPWREGIKKIDVVGSLSLVAATISFLLAMSWGGVDYSWQSPIIICLFVASALLIALFIINEKYWFNKHPIIPLELFKTRNYVLCSIGSFLLGFVMFGVIYYIPLYFQYVRGASATASGLQLLPTMLGIVLFGAVSGLLITSFGHYKSYPIIGMGFMMIGIYLLSLWDHNSTQSEFIGYQCFIGVGIGLTMQILVLIVQNSVNVIYISISTATVSFFRTIGGVVSVSVFSAILNQQFSNNLSKLLEVDAFVLGGISPVSFNIEFIRHIDNPIYKSQIIDAYQSALSIVFLSAAPFAGLGCILILFVKNEKLRTTMITQKDKDQELMKKALAKLEKEREEEADEMYNSESVDINDDNNIEIDINGDKSNNTTIDCDEDNNNNNNNNIDENNGNIELEIPNRKTSIAT